MTVMVTVTANSRVKPKNEEKRGLSEHNFNAPAASGKHDIKSIEKKKI